jgi:hypothetical protein
MTDSIRKYFCRAYKLQGQSPWGSTYANTRERHKRSLVHFFGKVTNYGDCEPF